MSLPTAVSPNTFAPGIHMSVDLLAASPAAGSQPLRALVMAPKSSVGTITADTQIVTPASASEAATYLGTGTPGALAFALILALCPTAVIDIVSPAESGGAAATQTITFAATTITTGYNVQFTIMGRVINVPWNAGESKTDLVGTTGSPGRAVTYINAQSSNLSVTASAPGTDTGVLTLTFKSKGPWGNDCTVACVLQSGAGTGVTVTAGGSTLSGGTTEPDFTTALSTVATAGKRYDFILPCLSNADAQSSSASSNQARLKTKINLLNKGRNARLQRAVIGCTGALTATITGAVANNDPAFQFEHCINGQSLPSELGAHELAQRMAAVAIDPAANRIGTVMPLIYGSANLNADQPTATQIETAGHSGVSLVAYDASNQPVDLRPITAHSLDANGNYDGRCLDTSGVDGVYAVMNDIEAALPGTFPQAKLSKNLAEGAEPNPPGVIEERDVFSWLCDRLRFWQRRGVVRADILDQVIAAGQALQYGTTPATSQYGALICQVDPTDNTQLDIVLPFAIFPPLAKFSVVGQKVAA